MVRDYRVFPPLWKLDAVPSDRGWKDPKPGELLVSVKGGVLQYRTDYVKPEIINETISISVLPEETSVSVLPEESVEKVIDEKETPEENNLTEEKPKRRKKNANSDV